MNRTRPRSARAVSGGIRLVGNSAFLIAPWKNVGPSKIPARISPSTGGWPRSLAAMPSRRAAMMMNATSASSSWTSLRLMVGPPPRSRHLTVTVRVILEAGLAPQANLDACRQRSAHSGLQVHGVPLPRHENLGAVRGIEVGEEDLPAVELHAGVDPGH